MSSMVNDDSGKLNAVACYRTDEQEAHDVFPSQKEQADHREAARQRPEVPPQLIV